MQLRPEWNEPSDKYGAFGLLRNLVPLFSLYGAMPYLTNYSLYLAWSLAPLMGLLLYRLTIIMHDCVHATLFRSRQTIRLVGEFLGAVTGIDLHEEHHCHPQVPSCHLPDVHKSMGRRAGSDGMLHTLKALAI